MSQPSIEQIHEFQHALRQLKVTMRQSMSEIASQQIGMEFNHFVLLFMINSGLNTPSQIRDRMEISASMVSHLLDRCQKADLIDRRIDPDDSRRNLLSLTDRGETLMNKLKDYYAERIRASGMTAEQLVTMTAQLQQLTVPFSENREEQE